MNTNSQLVATSSSVPGGAVGQGEASRCPSPRAATTSVHSRTSTLGAASDPVG